MVLEWGTWSKQERNVIKLSGDMMGKVLRFKYLESFLQKNSGFVEDMKQY